MVTDLEYAIMAGRAYQSTRSDINLFPSLEGYRWQEPIDQRKFLPSGFEAGYFQRDDKIVISFAGTYEKSWEDVGADINLGTGYPDEQLIDAALYYLEIRQTFPNTSITLTGHSLGGGLAALIGVFFNEDAITFNQGPFRKVAASSLGNIDGYEYLLNILQQRSEINENLLQPLEEYVSSMLRGNSGILAEREQKVTSISVEGEFLTNDTSNALRIGQIKPPIKHGGVDVSGIDLHSMALLTAFLQNENFRAVTSVLPDLLPLIFNSKLYCFISYRIIYCSCNFREGTQIPESRG